MQAIGLPEPVLAAATSRCVVEPERLNSELIADRFGSYGIDIVDVSDGVRRSSLYSVDGETKVCRTFAVVSVDSLPSGIVDTEHALVMHGESIGATFKAHGWQVYKETAFAGQTEIPADSSTIPELMRLESGAELALHIYRLLLSRGNECFHYATVVELHHPDHLRLEDVESIYVIDTPAGLREEELDNLTSQALRNA